MSKPSHYWFIVRPKFHCNAAFFFCRCYLCSPLCSLGRGILYIISKKTPSTFHLEGALKGGCHIFLGCSLSFNCVTQSGFEDDFVLNQDSSILGFLFIFQEAPVGSFLHIPAALPRILAPLAALRDGPLFLPGSYLLCEPTERIFPPHIHYEHQFAIIKLL